MRRPGPTRAALAALLSCALLAGCAESGSSSEPDAAGTEVQQGATSAPGTEPAPGDDVIQPEHPGDGTTPPPDGPPADAGGDGQIAAFLQEVTPLLPADSGIALVPVGRPDAAAATGLDRDVAWSSIKVPLAIAALRAGVAAPEDVELAITISDNGSAERLWEGLGGGEPAAAAVEAVLREGGDVTTVVPRERQREGFTVFGQAQWSTLDQARFAAALPCMADPAARQIYEMMGRIDPSQQWGLGALGAHFKGGWGPGVSGGYLARQLGVIDTGGGQMGVAVIARGGDLGGAQQALGQIVTQLEARGGQLPGGQCGGPQL